MWFYAAFAGLWAFLWWPIVVIVLTVDTFFFLGAVRRLSPFEEEPYKDGNPLGPLIFCAIIAAVVVHLFGIYDVVAAVRNNPMVILNWMGVYLGAGLIYMCAKGLFRVWKKRREALERRDRDIETWYAKKRQQFMRNATRREEEEPGDNQTGGQQNPVRPFRAEDYEEELNEYLKTLAYLDPPKAERHYTWMVVTWIVWLPDLIVSMIFEYIEEFMRAILRLFRRVIQAVINSVWGDLRNVKKS